MTPSIRETLLTFHTRANLATEHLRREAEQLREEAPCLGPAFSVTRRLVAARLGEIEHEADVLERDLIAETAALLCLRTDDEGNCDIDLPAKRPAGRPKKSEAAALAAARAALATNPPADPPQSTATPETPTTGAGADAGDMSSAGEVPIGGASGLGAAFELANEWASCDAGKAHGHAISIIGYTANELAGLGDVQIRAICKHRIAPAEFGGVVVGGVLVDGVAWLMETPARVVT